MLPLDPERLKIDIKLQVLATIEFVSSDPEELLGCVDDVPGTQYRSDENEVQQTRFLGHSREDMWCDAMALLWDKGRDLSTISLQADSDNTPEDKRGSTY